MFLNRLIFIFIVFKCTESANILGVFPMSGSHYILGEKLMKGLAEAGHNVTMISANKLKVPPRNGQYTDITLEGFAELFQTFLTDTNLFEMQRNNFIKQLSSMINSMVDMSNQTLHDRGVKNLLQSDVKFDVVIVEQFMNDALKVFSHIYACPLISLSSQGPNGWVNPTVGNPQPVATTAAFSMRNFSPDSICDRTINAFLFIADYFLFNYLFLPKFEKILNQAFPNSPSVYDLNTNISLLLLNSHTSIYDAVPMVPNMVEIGGYFIDPPQKLPEDLKDFLDSAKDGAIYFSMGSALRSKDMPEDKKKVILSVLGKLKQKVIWKFEEDLPEKPSNMIIKKWLPQQDILAHPNIKLFITHGGILSTTETVHHAVPILAIPVFADQPANAERAVNKGFGLTLGYHDPDFSEEKLSDLINELLNNPKYKENALKYSKIYHDRPQKPMDTAVYWVEYIIRHKGATHLRVAGIRMPWYKYFMVDVIVALILSLYVAVFSIKLVFRKICCRNKKSYKKLKTN